MYFLKVWASNRKTNRRNSPWEYETGECRRLIRWDSPAKSSGIPFQKSRGTRMKWKSAKTVIISIKNVRQIKISSLQPFPLLDRHIFWDDDSNFHTLEIIHSTLEDSGCYMVTARNVNGSVSCRCNLVVDKGIRAYVAPDFLRGLDAAYTIHSGQELRMSAQLEAYPSVGVVWWAT